MGSNSGLTSFVPASGPRESGMKNMHEALMPNSAAVARTRERAGASGPAMSSRSTIIFGRNCSKRWGLPSWTLCAIAWFRCRKRKTSLPSITMPM